MQVVVLTNESLKEELLNGVSFLPEEVVWIEEVSLLQDYREADVYIDLLFEKRHIAALQRLQPKLVIVNSVDQTLPEIDPAFVRINGWNTFLKSSLVEGSSLNEYNKQKVEAVFRLFDKKIEWVDDIVGFITPRVISMIINEAFISLKEGVSTKEEIDIAMKPGTNYPYGPFEWAEKIGVGKIEILLEKLSKQKERYTSLIG